MAAEPKTRPTTASVDDFLAASPPVRQADAAVVRDLLAERDRGQTALMVFAGKPFPVTPLTDDTNTLVAQLETLNPSLMPVQGSDVAGAISGSAALLGIAAMGVQSAMVRMFMHGVPSTNVMTTNTTQLAIDATIALIALARGASQSEAENGQARGARARLKLHAPPMAGFVSGTAIGAVCYEYTGAISLVTPLLLSYALLAWSIRGGCARPSPSPSAR